MEVENVKPIPIVTPCCFCGLPLLREMTSFTDDQIWKCSNTNDCIGRAREQSITNNNGVMPAMDEELIYYRSVLRDDPNFAWRYHFIVSGVEFSNKTTIDSELYIDGPWDAFAFDAVVADAYQIAEAYNLDQFEVKNSAGYVLYAD